MRVSRLFFPLFATLIASPALAVPPDAAEDVEIYAPNQEQVNLSWKDVADDETNYYVDRWNSTTMTWDAVGTLPRNAEVFRFAAPSTDEQEVRYRVAPFLTGENIESLNWVEASLTKPSGPLDLVVGEDTLEITEGLSSRANVNFTHQILVSGGTPETYIARDLPTGVVLDSVNGTVSGAVASPGVYRFFVGVTFDSTKQFEQVRYLRVLPGSAFPTVASPGFSLPAQNLGVEGVLPIDTIFTDPNRPLGATFETPKGFFTVALHHQATPKTVLNFLTYVLDKQYNYSILHRADPGTNPNDLGFVIQGGGFYPASNTVPTAWGRVQTYGNLPNEPGISNTRGTIAMAKIGGDPDSATSQWFVSVGNNNPSILDRQNGGFTVFGKVVGNGMDVVDDLLNLKRGNYSVTVGGVSSSLTNVPVRTDPAPASLGFDSIVYFPSVVSSPAVEISLLNNSNPSILTAEVVGMGLYLKSLNKIGSTNITLRATNLDGLTADFTFPVTINDLSGPGVRLISIRGSRIPGALLVKGRAVDNNALRSYRYRVNGKRWFNGGRLSGKDTIFKKTMRGFKAGKNRLEIEVFDSRGQSSGILKQKFTLG